jgi:hypothetical protein
MRVARRAGARAAPGPHGPATLRQGVRPGGTSPSLPVALSVPGNGPRAAAAPASRRTAAPSPSSSCRVAIVRNIAGDMCNNPPCRRARNCGAPLRGPAIRARPASIRAAGRLGAHKTQAGRAQAAKMLTSRSPGRCKVRQRMRMQTRNTLVARASAQAFASARANLPLTELTRDYAQRSGTPRIG